MALPGLALQCPKLGLWAQPPVGPWPRALALCTSVSLSVGYREREYRKHKLCGPEDLLGLSGPILSGKGSAVAWHRLAPGRVVCHDSPVLRLSPRPYLSLDATVGLALPLA